MASETPDCPFGFLSAEHAATALGSALSDHQRIQGPDSASAVVRAIFGLLHFGADLFKLLAPPSMQPAAAIAVAVTSAADAAASPAP